jgi:hypothetical protein
VKHQHKSFLVRFVDVGGFHQEEVQRLVDKGQHVTVPGDLINVFDHFDEGFVVESPWRKSVRVGSVNQSLRDCHSHTKFLLHKIHHLCKMDLVDWQEHG